MLALVVLRRARRSRRSPVPRAAPAVRRRVAGARTCCCSACCSSLTLARVDAAAPRRSSARCRRSASRRRAIAGELEAARRIQIAILPRARSLARRPRASSSPRLLSPAREVGRRPLRLLHARPRTAFVLIGGRRRQGTLGGDLHGGEQGALEERGDARARRRHRRHHDAPRNAEISRDNREHALRDGLRRDPRPARRRARVLQRRPREPPTRFASGSGAPERLATATGRRCARSTTSRIRSARRQLVARRAARAC